MEQGYETVNEGLTSDTTEGPGDGKGEADQRQNLNEEGEG